MRRANNDGDAKPKLVPLIDADKRLMINSQRKQSCGPVGEAANGKL
jgi:hypothetical protein